MSQEEEKTNPESGFGGRKWGHESLWSSEGKSEQKAQVTKVSVSVLAPG